VTKRLQVYQAPGVVVTFDPNLCQHSGVCVRGLPLVFDVSRPDWVHPDAATATEVAALIARCPSGALQAVRPGIAPGVHAAPAGGVTITVQADGPTLVRGPVTLELPSGAPQARSSFALCRCGRSKEAPFCDGSHATAGFRFRS
jgi:uncharacterized Fe-S cluster protein YjdI